MTRPATNPEEAAASVLANASLGLTLGTNLFHGPLRPADTTIPHAAVFCFVEDEGAADPYLNNHKDFCTYRVKVVVRGAPEAWSTGLALARSAWGALHRANVTSSGYVASLCRGADPTYLGLDDTEHPQWTFTSEFLYSG